MKNSRADYTSFTQDDVETLQKETVFKGYFQVDRYTLRHKVTSETWSAPVSREIFERGHAAGMLPYDPVLDRVILVEQFRAGALSAGYTPWLLEVPAGIIDNGDDAAETARRETKEETGCTALRMELIADYLVTPGGSSESLALFCVEVDSREALDHAGLPEEGEYIRIHDVSRQQALDWLKAGQIHNSTGMIALQWLALHGDEIRKKWCS